MDIFERKKWYIDARGDEFIVSVDEDASGKVWLTLRCELVEVTLPFTLEHWGYFHRKVSRFSQKLRVRESYNRRKQRGEQKCTK